MDKLDFRSLRAKERLELCRAVRAAYNAEKNNNKLGSLTIKEISRLTNLSIHRIQQILHSPLDSNLPSTFFGEYGKAKNSQCEIEIEPTMKQAMINQKLREHAHMSLTCRTELYNNEIGLQLLTRHRIRNRFRELKIRKKVIGKKKESKSQKTILNMPAYFLETQKKLNNAIN